MLGSWLHRLLNPHCDECRVCPSCETLKMQLNIVNAERDRLLDSILNPKVVDEKVDRKEVSAIAPKVVPWSIQRRILEEEDRVKARILREKNDELEKELKIPENKDWRLDDAGEDFEESKTGSN